MNSSPFKMCVIIASKHTPFLTNEIYISYYGNWYYFGRGIKLQEVKDVVNDKSIALKSLPK